MKTETKKLIYPGNHGQASFCHYKIGFDETSLRPKVVVLIWDAEEGFSTPINNNGFTDDVIINLIFERNLKGIPVIDVVVITPSMLGIEDLVLKKLPIKMFVEEKLGAWDLVKQQLGLTKERYINVSDRRCAEIEFHTADPVKMSEKERAILSNVFPELSSVTTMEELYSLFCNTTNTTNTTEFAA